MPAATCAALVAFGRPDLAGTFAAEHNVDPAAVRFRSPREALQRVACLSGSAASQDLLLRLGFEAASAARVEFAGGGGLVGGASPAGTFGPAVRDAAQQIVAAEWPRGGQVFRAAARTVTTQFVDRVTRCYIAASGSVATEDRPEAGELRTAALPDWPHADVRTAFQDVGKFKPSRQRVVNSGGVEYGAFSRGGGRAGVAIA